MLERIKQLRNTAAEALNKAIGVRDTLKASGVTDWPSDKQEEFDKAMADFHKAHGEAEKLQAKHDSISQLDDLREQYNRPANTIKLAGGKTIDAKLHREAFGQYIRFGPRGVNPQERHALISTDKTLGGFLTSEDFRTEVIKAEAGFAVVRALGARVVNTSKDSVAFPTVIGHASGYPRTSGFAGKWRRKGAIVGGAVPALQNQPTFGKKRIQVNLWQPDAIEIEASLIEDEEVGLEQILADVIGETKGLDEDECFMLGEGDGEPEGIMNAGITTIKTGAAAALTYGGLVDLFVGLPAPYRQNGKFAMNSKTYGSLLKLEDTEGHLIIPANTTPGTLWNKPIGFMEFMDDVGADKEPIVFGAWRYYGIAERRELRVQRLEEKFAPNIGLLPTARVGGQVLLLDAFRIQTVSA